MNNSEILKLFQSGDLQAATEAINAKLDQKRGEMTANARQFIAGNLFKEQTNDGNSQ